MISRDATRRAAYLAGLALCAVAVLGGCEKKKKKPPPPPPPVVDRAPPPPPKVEVATLLQELNSDARVQFPEASAPTDRDLAEEVIRFANALARGDEKSMRPMLDRAGQAVLDELIGNGSWGDATASIEAVRIVRLTQSGFERPSAMVATAIQDRGGAYVLNWNATPRDTGYVFAPALSPGEVKPRASDWDSAVITASLDLPEDRPGAGNAPGAKDKPADQPTDEPADDPNRKNTPGGPITVPTGPGGG
jgi:hypothetical protein